MPLTPQEKKSVILVQPDTNEDENEQITHERKEIDNQIFESNYYEEIRDMVRPKTSQPQVQKINETFQVSSQEELENIEVSLILAN